MPVSGSWSAAKPTGSKPCARASTQLVSDGSSTFLFGGCQVDEAGDPICQDDMFQLVTAGAKISWKAVRLAGDVPQGREGATIVTMDSGAMYMFGGSRDDTDRNDVYSFNPGTMQWKAVNAAGSGPPPVVNHAAAAIGNNMYVFGGFQDGLAVNTLFKLDTRMNKWTSVPAPGLPAARCNHCMVAADGKLWVFGGRGGEMILFNDVYCFDPDTKSWTKPKTSGTAPQGRDFCSATLLPDGKSVLVFGGSRELGEDAEYFNDAHIFDTGSGAWSPLAAKGAPPSVRYSHAAALVGNKVFVFGGTEGSGDFLDLDDLHVLTVDGAPAGAKMPGAVKLPQAAPPRRKPSVPTPTSAAPQAAPPRRSASGDYVPTKKLDVDYAQPTPAPAARRKVAPKVLKEVAKRDYDEVQAGMVDSLERIFAKIKAEYSQIDNARQELNADREAFEKEKLANEQMHEQQQADLAAAVEKHKAETEAWLEKHVLENDRVRKELADVRAELGRDRAKLTREEEKLRLSNEQLAEEEANFQERSKKMDALMAQFKGI